MAAQKKKSTKKNSKSKADTVGSINPDSSFFAVLTGWLVAAIGALVFAGCLTVTSAGEENWLGPYLGGALPGFATYMFGRVGIVLFSIALALSGICVAMKPLRGKLLRFAVGCTLLSFNMSFLLALKTYGEASPSSQSLSMCGGAIGHFFNQYVMLPFFGKASIISPLCVLLFCLVLILVLSFGLRPRHFAFIKHSLLWLGGLFHKKESSSEEELSEPDRADDGFENRKGVSMMSDDTMIGNINDFRILRKNKLKPFNGRANWLANDTSEFSAVAAPTLTQAPYAKQEPCAKQNPVVDCEPVNAIESHEPETAAYDPQQADPEIARLEEELRRNEGRMNALQIMEIRDRIAALRRARDLIKWEKEHHGRLVVKGAVRGDGNVVTPATGSVESVSFEAETLAASAEVSADAPTKVELPVEAKPDYENDPTEVPSLKGEDLLGGDGARTDEFVENDDTFVPEVVGADEVGIDPVVGRSSGTTLGHAATIPQPDLAVYDEYKVPPIGDILEEHEVQSADYTEDELNAIGRMLEEKLENFKVKGKVVGCETGPMITRFEVEPGPGVKVSQFSALHEDLALALKVTSIRILTPIPGKGAVGIEIPNRKFQTVYGRDVFESEKFSPNPEKILVALGKDITGEAFTMDIAKAPHLLIAGQTGSGKSVCINALMASILFSKTPDELRMILVDPKAVELKMYENIPHLLAPVITKPEIAIQALEWLCYEMDRRTEVLALAKVRNIGGFNMKFDAGELPSEVPEEDRGHRMAFIVVIIDELADLMMVAGKEIEKSIARLAAKARAVGIHLVLATQRPSVKVVTGIIKANLPTRISFKVASQIDARTVMDRAGAEKLLGRGDMLYKAVNDPDPVRVHGAFLSDEEAEKLADACSNQNVNYPQLETFEIIGGGDDDDGEGAAALNEKKDKLLFEVAKWAIEVQGLSTSAVQRHFSVGYSRAGKIVDQLYGLGVCGPSKGNSKPRAMLIDFDGLMNLERSGTFR